LTFSSAPEYEDIAVSLPGKSFRLMVVIVVEDALEILKSYRQQHLYATLGLLRIPLLSKDMEQRFSCQFLCRCSSSQLFFLFFAD